jgi:hypothetical protein
VSISRIDAGTGERLGLLATAAVGEGGWVGLTEPIIDRNPLLHALLRPFQITGLLKVLG